MKGMHASALAAMLVCGGAVSAVRADDLKEMKQTARAIAKKTARAVVAVRLTVQITIGDREPQDQKLELTGTVIDESGLTVVPASALDPMQALGGFGRGGRRGGGGGGGGGGQMQIDSEITSTAIVLDDGKELAADIVLKDAELDIAFLKPHDAVKLDHVDLKAGDRTPEPLDDIFCVGRLGRGANHVISIATGEVRAVVKGSKGFYVCDNEISTGHLGCVAYAADGTPLGIFATRTARPEGGAIPGGGGMFVRRDSQVVIRPAADILELAAQAKEKKAEKKDERKKDEKKPEEKKPEEKKKPEDKKKGDDF